ncbi:hypothetical protein [Cecembia rubra]|uniref:Uncharacterized protein n=1 Tax=Cecembia rubra TaxID=1485585 RepID=A0A2P8DK90_9BACT|nr:hypothetical protein [Cecembia rubra]PSK97608.1 hypothetical protein CLV48_12125 [Cecembia rubra]
MKQLIGEIFKRNKALARFGLINFAVFFFLMILSFFDGRTLLGTNLWFKPMKFALSIGLFSWTMAWFLAYIGRAAQVKKIQWTIILMMTIEQLIIIAQAARAELSHFNISSLLNNILFNIMGIAIFVNTIVVFWTFLLIRKEKNLPKGYKMGILSGMLIFCIASLQGFVMAANLGHTWGAADGQEGIFFLNWAKGYIDLRIFHFLGLHALQIIPLFAWYFAKDSSGPVLLFSIFFISLASTTLWIVFL